MPEKNEIDSHDIDTAIDQELTKREKDPQLRIAEGLAEIALQLQKLNEHLDTTVKHGLSGIASAAQSQRR
jgi:hypothetical protein